jgi:hypothetical protein
MYLCVSNLQTNSSSCVNEFGGGKPLQMASLTTQNCSCLEAFEMVSYANSPEFYYPFMFLTAMTRVNEFSTNVFDFFTYRNLKKGAGAHNCGPTDSSAQAATEIRGLAPLGALWKRATAQ